MHVLLIADKDAKVALSQASASFVYSRIHASKSHGPCCVR